MSQKVERQEKLEAVGQVDKTERPSLIEEVTRSQKRVERADNASLQRVIAEADHAVDKINSINRKLSTPGLDLKSSVQNVMRSKLSHIDESLKIALSKVGVDYVPADKPSGLVTPIQNFVNYLTHGQHQLENISSEVSRLHANRDQLSAGALLTLQMKMGFVTQELEFFTSLLNKALESTKTLMNVQV